ncbi:MAG: lipid-A-disaccharide synthase [Candidatus Eremiobacteraeota bacterium]|nr:lipid-A-disaccharide synthase [Candidatus Eremiobacteraeota bacterium]
MSKKIMVLAGEASGDLQGAHLAATIRHLKPSYKFFGIGGARMKSKGVMIFEESTSWGIIGPWHALGKIPFLLGLVKRVKAIILKERPDLLILIDTPSINMRIARFAHDHGVKTLYFFPPSAWFPSVERVKKIARVSDYLVPAFTYTVKTYRRAGIPVNYFGHPLVDMLEVKGERDELVARLGLPPGKDYVALMPGSRHQEIVSLLPVLVKTKELLMKERKNLHFILPMALPLYRPLIEGLTAPHMEGLTLAEGNAHEVMKLSRCILMASGSASLEAAILGVPMVVLYKLAWPDWCIGKLLIKVPHISLPNLILQKRVVPELVQLEVNPRRIAAECLPLIDETPGRRMMLEALLEVRLDLGSPGVTKNIAQFVVDICENGS